MWSPTTQLEIHGQIRNLLCAVDTHLVIASSVAVNNVEHDHEDDPVWKFHQLKFSPSCSEELLHPLSVASTNRDGIFDSANFVKPPTNEFANGLAMIGLVSKTMLAWWMMSLKFNLTLRNVDRFQKDQEVID